MFTIISVYYDEKSNDNKWIDQLSTGCPLSCINIDYIKLALINCLVLLSDVDNDAICVTVASGQRDSLQSACIRYSRADMYQSKIGMNRYIWHED